MWPETQRPRDLPTERFEQAEAISLRNPEGARHGFQLCRFRQQSCEERTALAALVRPGDGTPVLDWVMAKTRTLDAEAFRRFVDAYRAQCLWFMRPDYYPETPTELAEVLRLIERHGDCRAFRQAAEFRQWLSRRSSETSAVF